MEKTILYIDDEKENLTVFEFSFHRYFKVFLAENVEQGMKIILENPVQVVISDQRMPGKSGIAFFEELSVSHPEIIRILLTAYGDIDAAINAINRGKVYHFLNKPFDLNNLKNILEKAIETYNLRKQNQQLIQELQRNNEALKEALSVSELNEKKFKNIFNTSMDAIVIISAKKNTILEANAICAETLGFKPAELQNRSILDIVPEKYRITLKERLIRIIAGEKVPLLEFEILSNNGETVYVETNSQSVDYAGEKAVLSIIRNVTERKKMQREMMKITIDVEENERKKLSSDLHDEVGPLLSSMNMMLSSLSHKPELAKFSEIISNIKHILKETIATVREISYNISPHVLNYYGLKAAIKNFFETKRGLIEVNFSSNLDSTRFSETIEIMLYRIVKEVFNNTLKYAGATKISLAVQITDNILKLVYTDDGKGFDMVHQKNAGGLGMLSIINRVSTIGGDYSIDTRPGKGFNLEITIDTTRI